MCARIRVPVRTFYRLFLVDLSQQNGVSPQADYNILLVRETFQSFAGCQEFRVDYFHFSILSFRGNYRLQSNRICHFIICIVFVILRYLHFVLFFIQTERMILTKRRRLQRLQLSETNTKFVIT